MTEMTGGPLLDEVLRQGAFESRDEAQRALRIVVEGLRAGLKRDGKVELRGFARFSILTRRRCRWRGVGKYIERFVRFRPGKGLLDHVREDDSASSDDGGGPS